MEAAKAVCSNSWWEKLWSIQGRSRWDLDLSFLMYHRMRHICRGHFLILRKKNQIEEALFKAILRKLDFERIQFEKEIQDFSGGQKKKVLIAKSLCEQAHLYVWDEPLNFVDLYSRMQIEQLIREFSPTMLLVEHDQAFREAVATKTVQIEGAENEKRNWDSENTETVFERNCLSKQKMACDGRNCDVDFKYL